ncbi:hypothetical protein Leryth_005536 [Lithospermum erythrorhizon]|nr:hypothetical protein Leryth_005536 [Lithospermum erythrorhizon]
MDLKLPLIVPEEKFQKSYYDVLGLCCSSEVKLIEKILNPLNGIKDVKVVVPTKTVIVTHDQLIISQLEIVKKLNEARLEANVRARRDQSHQKKWPSPSIVVCGVLLLASFFEALYPPLKWLALGSVAVGIFPIFLKVLAALRNFTVDINVLMFIAVCGSIVLKDYWEAGTIVFLFTTSEWLGSRASHKASSAMSSLVNVLPQRAVIAETNEEVDADEVNLNTILAVKAGETVPIDGIVVQGTCEMDEKTLTGESFPVSKQKGSTVWAGSINLNGYISIITTAVAKDCAVAKMAKLVEDAQNNKSRTQTLIDNFSKYYTPVVLAISVCFVIVPAALRVENQEDWYRLALVILVSACPCALILSTPVAMFCALSKAATSGLLFKGAEYLETLATIKIMAFDKTGTITRGEFIVTDFRSLSEDVSLETLLYWVSSIESKSSHPMAEAVINHSLFEHSVVPKPDQVEEFQNFPGEGVYGKIDGRDIYIGNHKISLRAACATVPTIEVESSGGKSIGYIFVGSNPAGVFTLSDDCRTGAKEALKELKQMGIKTVMLTGDNRSSAIHAQSQLEGALDVVHAKLLPEDKSRMIQHFQEEGPIAMIGDGVNDAPALATADIGISMGVSGSALATETGNVILMTNDIGRIPKAVRLSRKVRRKVIENVVLSMSTKAVIVAIAIAGYPLVWAAVLADVGTALLVILNSMLLLSGTEDASHTNKDTTTTTSSNRYPMSSNGSRSNPVKEPGCCGGCGNDSLYGKNNDEVGMCFDHEPKNHEVDIECGAPVCLTVDMLKGNNQENCSGQKASPIIEEKNIGGCCKMDCCSKNSNSGADLKGGFSEIVIK